MKKNSIKYNYKIADLYFRKPLNESIKNLVEFRLERLKSILDNPYLGNPLWYESLRYFPISCLSLFDSTLKLSTYMLLTHIEKYKNEFYLKFPNCEITENDLTVYAKEHRTIDDERYKVTPFRYASVIIDYTQYDNIKALFDSLKNLIPKTKYSEIDNLTNIMKINIKLIKNIRHQMAHELNWLDLRYDLILDYSEMYDALSTMLNEVIQIINFNFDCLLDKKITPISI